MTDPFSVKNFMSGGSVAAKFPTVGATNEGTVLSFRITQRTDMKSGELLFWEGREPVEQSKVKFEASKQNPCQQLLLVFQGEPTGITWKTNQYIEEKLKDDDGVRTWYVHGKAQKALAAALAKAGNADIEEGAYVHITRTKSVKAGDFMAFTYDVVWTPAAKNEKAATAFVGNPDDEGADPFAS